MCAQKKKSTQGQGNESERHILCPHCLFNTYLTWTQHLLVAYHDVLVMVTTLQHAKSMKNISNVCLNSMQHRSRELKGLVKKYDKHKGKAVKKNFLDEDKVGCTLESPTSMSLKHSDDSEQYWTQVREWQ
ncbi:uncharacterized protein LAESUDRAFT_717905 [Laetiporus sulphureus 93-53]|uniref:Uncharacterized protein n=1 Tax=Laetiporus sulphureus 93-53 TaxID=1314785 RepID=A0A165BDX9_9APHY|nr:uncharacterized protein LAESUDRAFT_717905 [Laetiporus sulphureus 93-53]KZT00838.1 hypothetical protein LAESUDRAFT_717905 [Laetiporus sulphureus 93-53]